MYSPVVSLALALNVHTLMVYGTVRREYLDQVFFWNTGDLARKLDEFRDYYNRSRVHRSLEGTTPARHAGESASVLANLDHYDCRDHCRGLFQTPIAA